MSREADNFDMLCDYLDGTLTPEQRAEVEQMLAANPDLRVMMTQATEARGALRAVHPSPAPDATKHAIAATIASAQIRQSRWSSQAVLRLAAALLLTITLGVVTWTILPKPQIEPEAAPTYAIATREERKMADDALAVAPQASAAEAFAAPSRSAPALGQPMGPIGPMPTAPAAGAAPAIAPTEANVYYANAEATLLLRGPDAVTLGREIRELISANRLAISTDKDLAKATAQPPEAGMQIGRAHV